MRALDDYSSRVLDVVDSIPPGQVMSYGDIAEDVGAGGPRQVGRVLARHGGGVAWWRVIRADGTPAPGHESSALPHYLAEGTPLRSAPHIPPGLPVRVDMRRGRWTANPPFAILAALVPPAPMSVARGGMSSDERLPTCPRRPGRRPGDGLFRAAGP